MSSYKTGNLESAPLKECGRQFDFALALDEHEAAVLVVDLERIRQSPRGMSVESGKLLRALQGRLIPVATRKFGRVNGRTASR